MTRPRGPKETPMAVTAALADPARYRLTELDQTLLHQRFQERCSYAEIAAALGISIAQAKMRLRVAVARAEHPERRRVDRPLLPCAETGGLSSSAAAAALGCTPQYLTRRARQTEPSPGALTAFAVSGRSVQARRSGGRWKFFLILS